MTRRRTIGGNLLVALAPVQAQPTEEPEVSTEAPVGMSSA